jgi:hypothetical protein
VVTLPEVIKDHEWAGGHDALVVVARMVGMLSTPAPRISYLYAGPAACTGQVGPQPKTASKYSNAVTNVWDILNSACRGNGSAGRDGGGRRPGLLVSQGSCPCLHRPISRKVLTEESRCRIRALNDIAQRRGQALAQRGLAWCLRVICG